MSYDVNATCTHCGGSSDNWNYTSNCAPMWRAAGLDIAAWDGRPVRAFAEAISVALVQLEADPEKFRAMNPSNGWGSYETLLPALEQLRRNVLAAPADFVVRVCR